MMKLSFSIMLIFCIFLTTIRAGDDYHEEHEEDEHVDQKKKHDYVPRYRKPLDLRINVPFFKMLLKREKDGPSRLGIRVFPDHPEPLVDIKHQWWK
ncbi:unnamed protein product [Larinioides sclopetarius]|uniref:Uncharacterized protein n=1 Tax=Larinioides sclopetarius TaxID=280406 RepID=A0AAV2B8Z6_9ARAC